MTRFRWLLLRVLRPRVRRSLLLAVPFALYGCASAETQKVATIQVARDYYRARYDEQCHVGPPPVWCTGFDAKLNQTDHDLNEATAALAFVKTSGAKMPLQLRAIKADVRALQVGYKP